MGGKAEKGAEQSQGDGGQAGAAGHHLAGPELLLGDRPDGLPAPRLLPPLLRGMLCLGQGPMPLCYIVSTWHCHGSAMIRVLSIAHGIMMKVTIENAIPSWLVIRSTASVLLTC